jgi:alpha-amylase/alpha-mannosidase (GH57 family)
MTVSLLLGVHAHQPAGNFPEVVELAHARCYRPFLQTLHRYPDFRFAAHFSGWLLQYLFDHHPGDMALLREMVARGQAELFGGGDMEPVLAAIPTRDRIGQVRALSARLERLVGQRPRGAWLTERVWDSTVVPALADAGIEYVTVDDYHFLCTGKTLAELGGYFSTEEDGRNLDLFPISEGLRYRIPFAQADEAVRFIEDAGEHAAAVYFDDIEKFGIWPETYQWVYEKGWLQQFIEGVLASPRIQTRHFDPYRREEPARGVIYLPTTSYIEMNEWTLPAQRAHAYADLVRQERAHGSYERDKAFLRGGIWKNFLSRYNEANWMHKRMLGLSSRLDALPAASRAPHMLDLLYRTQANDAYWHGLFGGLYLPHLRRAVYNALVELESHLDKVAPRPAASQADLDLDGTQEIFLHNEILQAVIRTDRDAAVLELDSYSLRHNFGDTLQRREEHYYRRMHLGEQQHAQHEGIASAHDRVSFKHPIELADIEPDVRPRALFQDRCRLAGVWHLPQYMPLGISAGEAHASFRGPCGPAVVGKHVSLSDNRLTVRYEIDVPTDGEFETELNVAMPSCDGFLGRYVYEGRIPGGFGQPLELPGVTTLALEDQVMGGTLEVLCSEPVSLSARPHHTVSQSEEGFEKVMQAVTLTLRWPVSAGSNGISIALEVRRA